MSSQVTMFLIALVGLIFMLSLLSLGRRRERESPLTWLIDVFFFWS